MLKPTLKTAAHVITFVALGSISLTGCVDHDYDLSKDIDLNVTIGGDELNLPVSSTAILTMDELLDLDETSSIKKATQGEYGLNAGDYVLVEEPSDGPTTSDVKVNKIVIDKSGLKGDASTVKIDFPLDVAGSVMEPTGDVITNMNLNDDNVDKQMLTATEANCDVKINVHVTYNSSDYNGAAIIKAGTLATFPESWTLSLQDSNTASLVELYKSNVIKFKKDVSFHGGTDSGKGFNLVIDVIKFKLGSKKGEGLYEPGHFNLDAKVVFNGNMEIDNATAQPGKTADVRLTTTTDVTAATINSVVGTVNPDIHVNSTTVDVNDIPDFLSNQENNLDIKNPQIRVAISNNSPIKASLSAVIKAVYPTDSKRADKTIYIGEAYGKQAITLNNNGITHFCLCQTGETESGYTPIIVDELSELLSTIPQHIEISNVQVAPDTKTPVTVQLDHTYEFVTAYTAVVPFQFGGNMTLHYTTETDDWDTDLDGYNFSEVHVSMDIVNGTPFGVTPKIIAIDKAGNEMSNLTCTFSPNDGYISPNSTSTVIGVVKSTGENLKGLSGIKVDITANSSDGSVTLNANQTVQLNNINVSVHGGVTVDLDEI